MAETGALNALNPPQARGMPKSPTWGSHLASFKPARQDFLPATQQAIVKCLEKGENRLPPPSEGSPVEQPRQAPSPRQALRSCDSSPRGLSLSLHNLSSSVAFHGGWPNSVAAAAPKGWGGQECVLGKEHSPLSSHLPKGSWGLAGF